MLKLLKGGSGPGITDVTQLVDTKLCTAKRKATERDEVKDERHKIRMRGTRLRQERTKRTTKEMKETKT